MADYKHLDVTEAFRNCLTGFHDFNDAVRKTAIIEVRRLCQDRVHRSRRPRRDKSSETTHIIVSKPTVLRVYFLGGETAQAESTIEVRVYAIDPKISDRLADAVRQALTSMKVTVDVGSDTIDIAGCTLDDDGEFEPDTPRDDSDTYLFEYRQVWRVNHEQIVPSEVD